jgi:hypothetical protein
MHEVVLHSEHVEPDVQAPFDKTNLTYPLFTGPGEAGALTSSHINALTTCLTNIEAVLEVFLAMDESSIRCLPVFNFVRIAYGTIVLIKMYFSASSPKSELSKVINKNHIRVESYLTRLSEKFRAVQIDDKSRPASKFLIVIVMLRAWFLKQSKSTNKAALDAAVADTATFPDKTNIFAAMHAATREAPSPNPTSADSATVDSSTRRGTTTTTDDGKSTYSTPSSHMQPNHEYPTANTPLQLLSEIATNGQSAMTNQGSNTTAANRKPGSNPWFSLRYETGQNQPFMFDTQNAAAATSQPDAHSQPSDHLVSSSNDAAVSGTTANISVTATGLDALPMVDPAMSWANPSFGNVDFGDMGFDGNFDFQSMAMNMTMGMLPDGNTNFVNGGRYSTYAEPWLSDMLESMQTQPFV